MTTRQAPRALNKDARTIDANAKADKARKAASKKALREAAKAPEAETLLTQAAATQAVETSLATQASRNLAAAMDEAEATGMSFEEACESMGVSPETGEVLQAEKPRYQGPMLALVAARKAYVKGANGNPNNGDSLALILGSLTREAVVAVCLQALGLEHNPYLHLNPGQQSMNLRNKLRHAVKSGTADFFTIEAIARRVTAK